MAQGSQYYPSLVHQHNTLPQPPALSASGTFVLSSNPHDMLTTATTHDSPSPPSTSSSSSGSRVEHPPVFSMPPPHSSQPTASYESRYQRDDRYEPPLTEDDVDPDRIVARHQIRRQFREAVTLRDGARPYRVPGSRLADNDGQIYDRLGARMNPSPQPPMHYPGDQHGSEMQESLSPSPSSQHSSLAFVPSHSHSRSASSSGSSSAPRHQSPIYGIETSLLPHPSLEPPGSLVHLLWAPTKTTSNLGGKNKKQRLYSVDRKIICEFAVQNPTYKQEEIARKFNIERSTVSKILKHKHRWLRISNDETVYYAKDRSAKFPGLERLMRAWVHKCHEDNTPMTDALIAARALELARAKGYTEKEFKASPGWVENFKHRMGISKNRWNGRADWVKSQAPIAEDYETLEERIERHRWRDEEELPPLPDLTEDEIALARQTQPAPVPPPIVEPEPQRIETPPQVRRHPVWLPDQSEHVERPAAVVDSSHVAYPRPPSHSASPARTYEPEQIIEPPVGVTAYSEDGSVHIVVPQGPNYRPNVSAEPSHNDAETSIDTLLIFFKNVRPDMLSIPQRELLLTIKEELFMAGN